MLTPGLGRKPWREASGVEHFIGRSLAYLMKMHGFRGLHLIASPRELSPRPVTWSWMTRMSSIELPIFRCEF